MNNSTPSPPVPPPSYKNIIIVIIILFAIIIWCLGTKITWSCCWCNILSKTFLGRKKVKAASVSRKVHLVRENMCGSPLWSDSR